jgi:hypothetical protein
VSTPAPDDAPIFIIGTGRSGTTLLRQMLNAHPRIYITHEAFFNTYAQYTPKRVSASEWLELYFQTFSFAWMRVDPAEVRSELPAELPRERIAEAFRAVMRCKARQYEKPRFGEKSPLDVVNLGRIFRNFPDPRVIYIMRDPRATVASLKRMPFATSSTLLNSLLCAQQLTLLRPHLKHICEVKLEDLIADPRSVMQRVLAFVGEPWDEAVLDHTAHSPTDDVAPFPWFESAMHKAPRPDPGSPPWQSQLSPAWIRIIERINHFGMKHFGYPTAVLPREPGRLRQYLVQLGEVPALIASSHRARRLSRKIQAHFEGRRPYDPQQSMEDHLKTNPRAWALYPGFEMPRVPQLR